MFLPRRGPGGVRASNPRQSKLHTKASGEERSSIGLAQKVLSARPAQESESPPRSPKEPMKVEKKQSSAEVPSSHNTGCRQSPRYLVPAVHPDDAEWLLMKRAGQGRRAGKVVDMEALEGRKG